MMQVLDLHFSGREGERTDLCSNSFLSTNTTPSSHNTHTGAERLRRSSGRLNTRGTKTSTNTLSTPTIPACYLSLTMPVICYLSITCLFCIC